MPASNIKVFLRIRPSAKSSANFEGDPEDRKVCFKVEKTSAAGEVNNTKTEYTYRFDGLLGMATTQDEVFNTIAKPVVDDVLAGVNGTIFAYGQTGSGKTFTITGGAEHRNDRGLIPRTISYIFEAFKKAADTQYNMYISYLEIYNEDGFDLLRDVENVKNLQDLPKVMLRQDDDGNIHTRNLSVNVCGTEWDALNLLFIGDTNRVVAETPMNDASTRSHCLFIVWIESTKRGSDVVRRSKLHLVDLAGSERPSKTGVEGNLLKEARYINLSLLYLEQVITALHERSQGVRNHVPYRNSMMTSVLRDSLGGNCKTTMIGCIAVEQGNLGESISTCNFAQRVAQIQNNAKVNEELDPNLLIARLKREADELKEEVRIAKSGEEQALTPEGVEQCRALVLQYVSTSVDPKQPFVCGSIERLRASFRILRDMCKNKGGLEQVSGGGSANSADGDANRTAALEAEAKKLKLEVMQRDQEIGILMQMLSKHRGSGGDSSSRAFITAVPASPSETHAAVNSSVDSSAASGSLAATRLPAAHSSHTYGGGTSTPKQVADLNSSVATAGPKSNIPVGTTTGNSGTDTNAPAPKAVRGPPQGLARRAAERCGPPLPPASAAADLLLNPEKAFKVFSDMAPRNDAVEENKELLRKAMLEGKALGEQANMVRASINAAKSKLGQLRNERALMIAGRDNAAPLEDGPEEIAELQEIDRLKAIFKEHTQQLHRVKSEIENIQRFLEQSRVRMKKDFEAWFARLRREANPQNLDDEKKRELHEKIFAEGEGSSTPDRASPHASQLQPDASRSSAPRSNATTSAATLSARAAPQASNTSRSTRTGDSETDGDISAFYTALGELAKK